MITESKDLAALILFITDKLIVSLNDIFFSFLIVLIPEITSEAISKSFKTVSSTASIEGYLETIKASSIDLSDI